jgi:hypothetical protein
LKFLFPVEFRLRDGDVRPAECEIGNIGRVMHSSAAYQHCEVKAVALPADGCEARPGLAPESIDD